MKKVMIVFLMVGLVFSVTSCAMEQKKVEKER